MDGADDDRRVNTHPMDDKQAKKYDNYEMDRYPNNCIAEPALNTKTPLDKSQIKTKVIQTGEFAMDGDEYDKEFERRMWELFHGKNPADERNDSRYMTKLGNEDEEDVPHSSRKKNRLRGRKGKYYEQVDDEDQSFL